MTSFPLANLEECRLLLAFKTSMKECAMKSFGHALGPLTLVVLNCIWFTVPVALRDELHHRPVPISESEIRPALPSAGYMFTASRGRAMVRQGFVPCQPRCSNNLTSGTTTIPHGIPPAARPASSTAALQVADLELRALLEARREVLKETVEILGVRFREGGSSPDALVAANVALLEAELELSGSKVERVHVLQQLLEQHKELEQRMEEMSDLGVGRPEDYLTAKAARLTAEIELHKARKAE